MMPTSRLGLIALFVVLTGAIFAITFVHIRQEYAQIYKDVDRELTLTASLRSGQIANWFLNSRLEALRIVESAQNARMLAGYFKTSMPPRNEMRDWLKAIQQHQGYHDVLLVDTNGVVIACCNDDHKKDKLPGECFAIFQHAMRWGQPTWHDMHEEPGAKHVVIELLIPVADPDDSPEAASCGAVIFQFEPEEMVFPVFRVFPVTRRTGETYILEPKDAHLVYLTEPREGERSSFRLPFSHTNIVGVQVALGNDEMVIGENYRGKTVFAKGRRLSAPNWLIMAGIEREEVLRDFRFKAWRTAGFMGVVLLAIGVAILFLWVRREHAALRAEIRQQQKLEVILNSIGDAVIATDVRGRITRMNPVAEQLTGWPFAEARGLHLDEVFKIINGLTRQKAPSPADRVLAEGIVMGLANHTLLISRNGAEYTIADSGAPIRNTAAGDILGVVLVFRDATKNYARERDLCMRSHALDSTPTPIAFADLEGKISYVNPAFLRAWGIDSNEEAISRHVSSFWSDPEQARAVLAQLRHGRQWTGELEARKADGSKRTMLAYANLVKDPEDNQICYMASFLDVTDSRRMTEALKEARNAAETANRAKSLFLANMSHELRMPLNPIIGFADLLIEAENLTSEQRQFIHIIRQRSVDLLQLISDILDLSKIEADAVTLHPEPMALRPFCADINRNIEQMAQARDLSFSLIVDPAAPDMISADSLRLRQVLMNLLSNAIKFTRQGSVAMRVDLMPDMDNALRFIVQDTGIGLTPEAREHLFKPFTQGDMSFTRRFGGAGLGLAICQRLVRKMGGEITVVSEEGKGSIFSFVLRFPAWSGALEPPSHVPDQAQLPPPAQDKELATKRRVLVVEDDPSNRALLEAVLRRAGYQFVSAEDGEQGLKKFSEQAPDFVLLDIQLPGINGLDVAARIREMDKATNSHTPIVAVTSYAMHGDRERFLAAGMDAYVAKPIQSSILISVLKGLEVADKQS